MPHVWMQPKRLTRLLSVDATIWPSVFDGLPAAFESASSQPLRLWRDCQQVEEAVRSFGVPPYDYVMVAIRLFAESSDYLNDTLKLRLAEPSPDLVAGVWTSMGYEVADGYLQSAVWDMQFELSCDCEEDCRPLQINCNGLFANIGDATAYKHIVAAGVPSHAPFFVFELFIAHKDLDHLRHRL